MTCRNLPGVCGCKNVVHNDMLKTGTRLRMHGRGARWHLPHCHCEERSDAAIRSPCGSTKPKSNTLGEYEKRDGFPLGKRSCPRGQLHVSACHCEERSDVAIRSPCGSTKPKSNPLGEYEKHYEVALSTTTLPGFSAGTRIATPVCALVRNDMQKFARCLRLQERCSQ